MSKEIENNSASSSMNAAKTFAAIAILAVSLFGYYYFTEMHAVVRVLGLVIGVAAAGYVFYLTTTGRSWFEYLAHSKREVRQVVWPTRQETVQMTLIVTVVVILMGIFLWLVDMFFLWAVQLLTGQGG